MGLIISALVTLLADIAPLLSNSSAIAKIIAQLINIIPIVVKEFEDILPEVKNIIVALQSNTTTTADQLAQLAALDKQVDDAFDAAAAKVEAEDNSPAA
jgi:hypothetical protein